MNILILTAFTKKVVWNNYGNCDFGKFCAEVNLKYANKHNYSFVCEISETGLSDRQNTWLKIPFIKKHLPNYDYVVWIDADAIFLKNTKIEDFIDYHKAGNNFISMALFRPTDKSKCGMVETDKNGIVVEFMEKPSNSHLEWANAAVYIFSKESLNEIKNKYKKAKDISLDILPNFLGRISGYKINNYHIDIGTHESLTETIVRFQ